MSISRRTFSVGLAGLGITSSVHSIFAQDYPDRPIKWIIGYPAGGASDFLARVLSVKLQAAMGQPFIIENRPGAAGIIAMEALSRSAADGYTIANTGNGELVFNQALYKKLSYDADKDVSLVGTIAKIPLVLAIRPNLSVKDLPELIALAKKQPGHLNYGSGGIGHPNQLSMEMLKHKAGIEITAVSYRGMAPAVQDFLVGSVSVIFVDLATGVSMIRDGKMKAIAVSTKERLPLLPDVPSVQEQGVPDYDVYAWQGMVAPAGTPEPVIEKLAASLNTLLADSEVIKRFTEAGVQPFSSSRADFAALVKKDRTVWHPLIKSLNLSLN